MSDEIEDPAEHGRLQKEIETLTHKIHDEQKKVNDGKLQDITADVGTIPKFKLTTKRFLKGHIHKVTGVSFAGDNRHLVSGSLDGKLIIWDCWTGNKIQIIPLKSSWVMAVAFSPSASYVASGGMDNLCTIHDLNNKDPATGTAKILRELIGYEGFLSCCKFIDEKRVITGSGDMKINQWDVESGRKLLEMFGHGGDVVSMSMHPTDENILITGSVDKTAKLWDLRAKCAQQTFWGHEADINSVFYHSSGFYFSTASEDYSSRIFDIRADNEVGVYNTPSESNSLTSTVMSKSGRYLFAGGDDGSIHVWDSLKTSYVGAMNGHESRVTSLTLSENGIAIASASWDQNVRMWY